MSEIGKKRRPDVVCILTLLTAGLFLIIWIGMALEDLRKYRDKGINGYLIIALLFVFYGVLIFEQKLYYFLVFIVFIVGLLLVVVPVFFYISKIIDKEFNKLNDKEEDWANAAYMPVFGLFLIFPAFADNELWLLSFTVILMSAWVFLMQKVLNRIWQLAQKSHTLALPVMASMDNDDFDKEQKDEDYE